MRRFCGDSAAVLLFPAYSILAKVIYKSFNIAENFVGARNQAVHVETTKAAVGPEADDESENDARTSSPPSGGGATTGADAARKKSIC
jgi:hypothetical protein